MLSSRLRGHWYYSEGLAQAIGRSPPSLAVVCREIIVRTLKLGNPFRKEAFVFEIGMMVYIGFNLRDTGNVSDGCGEWWFDSRSAADRRIHGNP
jgi:hypothetical protein